MPYVITTHRPGKHERPIEDGDRYSRRAVATLDEARGRIYDALPIGGYSTLYQQTKALPETGGTIGPLPDGTVIEVERVDVLGLQKRTADALRADDSHGAEITLNLLWDMNEDAVIDAYNARQS